MHRKWPVAFAIGVLFLFLISTGYASLSLPVQSPPPDGAVRKGDPSRPQVALMFNVDWGEEFIAELLDVLEGAGARSTFFVTGRWAEKNPDVVREIHGRGHEVGNHGYRHAHVAAMPGGEVVELIEKNRELLRALLEVEPPPLFAPPYGECNATIVQSAEQLGYKTILWSLDTVDWKRPPPATLVKRLAEAEAGDLVLMHPTRPTVDALGDILRQLEERAIKAVTVSQLLPGSEEK